MKPFARLVIPLLLLLLQSAPALTEAPATEAALQSAAAPAPAPAQPSSQTAFADLVEEFIEAFFRMNPTSATVAGFHQHDQRIEDFSRTGLQRQVNALKDFERRFLEVTPGPAAIEIADRGLAVSFIRASLLRLESARMWEKNPDDYSSLASNTIFVLISRNFASPEERLRSVIARERAIPRLLAQARANLKNPPRIHTETALLQLPGIIGFFQNDVPAAFASVQDPKLMAAFRRANRDVIDALQYYERFLRYLLPHSNGDFRIGAEQFRKKLLYEEMVDTPLDHLLTLAYEDLRRNQAAFAETARQLDPARTPAEVLDDMERDHPEAKELLAAVRGTLGGLREFVEMHHIVTLPSGRELRVEESPPFMRATSAASLDAPGAFERHVNQAFYHVALPDPKASPEEIESHMRSYSHVGLVGTSIHEAYPGHFTQYLWQDRAPSRLRLFLATDFSTLGFGFAWTNVEGWAHYTEQMMIDEGYGRRPEGNNEEFLNLRLSQLQDALLRNARFVVGIEMHTGKMTYEEGIEFFRREAYQPQVSADRETRRGTSDPTYLIYTLGKLEILELREDYRQQRGEKFTLQEFHDRFLGEGAVPIKVVRRALLGEDASATTPE